MTVTQVQGIKQRTFPGVTVDYDQTLERMLEELNLNHPLVTTENFPSDETGQKIVTIHLISFDQAMKNRSIIKALDDLGLRPATLKELLAFGATNRNPQSMMYVVALGTTWFNSKDPPPTLRNHKGRVYVPYLHVFGSDPVLYLNWNGGPWWAHWQFVAIDK